MASKTQKPLGVRWFSFLVAALSLPIFSGCATSNADQKSLAFLSESSTTRDRVVRYLGPPSASFQEQKILTYRLGRRTRQGYQMPGPGETTRWGGGWRHVKYSLVLVFDDAGVLRRHKLVEVN